MSKERNVKMEEDEIFFGSFFSESSDFEDSEMALMVRERNVKGRGVGC